MIRVLAAILVAVATTVGATAARQAAIQDSDGLNGLFLVLLVVALSFGGAVAWLMMRSK